MNSPNKRFLPTRTSLFNLGLVVIIMVHRTICIHLTLPPDSLSDSDKPSEYDQALYAFS